METQKTNRNNTNNFNNDSIVLETTIENKTLKAKVWDAEMDLLECTFVGAETVQIDTSSLEYIQLDLATIKVLSKHIKSAEKYYDEIAFNAW